MKVSNKEGKLLGVEDSILFRKGNKHPENCDFTEALLLPCIRNLFSSLQ